MPQRVTIQFLILATLLAWKCMGGSSESRHQNGGQRLQGSKWRWEQPGESPFNPAAHYPAEKSLPRSSGSFSLCFKDFISSSLCACSLSLNCACWSFISHVANHRHILFKTLLGCIYYKVASWVLTGSLLLKLYFFVTALILWLRDVFLVLAYF